MVPHLEILGQPRPLDFDAMMVVASMVDSQLRSRDMVNQSQGKSTEVNGSQQGVSRRDGPHLDSSGTKIWSDLSGENNNTH